MGDRFFSITTPAACRTDSFAGSNAVWANRLANRDLSSRRLSWSDAAEGSAVTVLGRAPTIRLFNDI